MEFEVFNKQKSRLKEMGIQIPDYYFFIDDDALYTPKDIAELFNRHPKVVRDWFTVGLKKQGILPSIDPIRHKVTGIEFKKWMYRKDIERLAKDQKFQLHF